MGYGPELWNVPRPFRPGGSGHAAIEGSAIPEDQSGIRTLRQWARVERHMRQYLPYIQSGFTARTVTVY